jgi:hypothetical protein
MTEKLPCLNSVRIKNEILSNNLMIFAIFSGLQGGVVKKNCNANSVSCNIQLTQKFVNNLFYGQ